MRDGRVPRLEAERRHAAELADFRHSDELRRHVQRVVAAAPPLTDEQIDLLVRLLRPGLPKDAA